MTVVWLSIMQAGLEPPEVVGPKIFEYLNKALELDPNSDQLQFTLAGLAVWAEWDWEKGEAAFKKALELNPNNALRRVFYGHLLMTLQRPYEALSHARLAIELDPMDPMVLALSSVVYNSVGDRQTALNQLDKALSIDPEHYFTINLIEPIAFLNKDYEKAMDWIEKVYEVRDQKQPYIATGILTDSLYTNPRFIAIMKKMNLPIPAD